MIQLKKSPFEIHATVQTKDKEIKNRNKSSDSLEMNEDANLY